MSTVTHDTMTAEQFFEWVQQPANRGRRFELQHGEVIEMPPPGKYHGFVCGNVSRILGNFALTHRRGYVCSNDAGVIVGRDPDTVRGLDVTFYDDDETADNMQRQYAEAPPLLAVEVVSPHDRINDIMLRVTQLLHRGVKVVWVVDPEARDLSVCRAGQEPQLIQSHQTITSGSELVDFSCPANQLFATPSQAT